MSCKRPSAGLQPGQKGEAKPPPEPAIRPRKGEGRRVGATLPADLYVRFKAHVARLGVTGEQAIVDAIERSVGDRAGESLRP